MSQKVNNLENIEVMVNSCYGRWEPSALASELYITRMRQKNPKFIPEESFSFSFPCVKRHDPILLQIYKELGTEFDEEYSQTRLVNIPKIYENYYSITEDAEADGIEKVVIDMIKYKLDN
jgi:hypothetical protein